MFESFTRRKLLQRGVAAGAAVGLGELSFLGSLPSVSADEVKAGVKRVRLEPDIEPLVVLIEDTPREKVLEAVAERMRNGTSYQELLAAVFLAGVRGIQPRPVGFKFHAVLVINSAHLASLASPEKERWLPLFWAIDNFKNSQRQNKEQGNWSMAAVEEAKLPSAAQARNQFVKAMDDWDEAGADRAVTALARQAGAGEILELFYRYGARDFRDIGHKAIYVANSARTLNTIGWRHAEPVLRSLAYALLEHEGSNPAKRDAEPDMPWRENLARAKEIPATWQAGRRDAASAGSFLQGMRGTSAADASAHCVEMLKSRVHPSSIWDGVFLRAGELLMQQPGIAGLHCVTSANALHYAYQASGNDETRRMLLLQAAAFLSLFAKTMATRQGGLKLDRRLDSLEKADTSEVPADAVTDILTTAGKDRLLAAQKALTFGERGGAEAHALMAAQRRLIFSKGTDSHDYKFNSAALEDFANVGPQWRNRFLATTLFNQKGLLDKDNNLIARVRGAMGA